VQLQQRIVGKPVKCYSEGDGDAYFSEVSVSQPFQHKVPAPSQTEVCYTENS